MHNKLKHIKRVKRFTRESKYAIDERLKLLYTVLAPGTWHHTHIYIQYYQKFQKICSNFVVAQLKCTFTDVLSKKTGASHLTFLVTSSVLILFRKITRIIVSVTCSRKNTKKGIVRKQFLVLTSLGSFSLSLDNWSALATVHNIPFSWICQQLRTTWRIDS